MRRLLLVLANGALVLPLAILMPIATPAQHGVPVPPINESPAWGRTAAGRKTPAEILEQSRDSIAVIVAADDVSLKLGTGFFAGSDGSLITNYHVVEGAEAVRVRLAASGSIVSANKVKGYDLKNDLAVLAIETGTFGTLSLGDSDEVRVGESIVVVSNAEGLEQTVSNGLISGIREFDGSKVFQISAPVSAGSSGAPVFNDRGEAVGVVVASLKSGQNLNFAIPINYVKPLLSSPTVNLISSLPKRERARAPADNEQGAMGALTDPAKLAVQAIAKIADQIRACGEQSLVLQSPGSLVPGRVPRTDRKKTWYYRAHWGPPTDVRFDVRWTGSVGAPYEGVIEFSVYFNSSDYYLTPQEAAAATADRPAQWGSTARHRHVFRVVGPDAQLYDRKRYETWLTIATPVPFDEYGEGFPFQPLLFAGGRVVAGEPAPCWERIGYR